MKIALDKTQKHIIHVQTFRIHVTHLCYPAAIERLLSKFPLHGLIHLRN